MEMQRAKSREDILRKSEGRMFCIGEVNCYRAATVRTLSVDLGMETSGWIEPFEGRKCLICEKTEQGEFVILGSYCIT